jgi:hypothetical protein
MTKSLGEDQKMFAKATAAAVIASLAAALCTWLAHKHLEKVPAHSNTWEIFFSVFGVLYAIVVGLLVVDALTRLRDMSSTIQDEVSTVEDAWESIDYIDDSPETKPIKNAMKDSLLYYLAEVIKNEFKEMENVKRTKKISRIMSKRLIDVMKEIKKLDMSANQVAVQALIAKLADLTSHRSKRRELALHVFHHPLHILLYCMSIVMMAGFILLPICEYWLHAFVACSVAASLALLHVVIWDLDNPYGGYWAITDEPFLHMQDALSKTRA